MTLECNWKSIVLSGRSDDGVSEWRLGSKLDQVPRFCRLHWRTSCTLLEHPAFYLQFTAFSTTSILLDVENYSAPLCVHSPGLTLTSVDVASARSRHDLTAVSPYVRLTILPIPDACVAPPIVQERERERELRYGWYLRDTSCPCPCVTSPF